MKGEIRCERCGKPPKGPNASKEISGKWVCPDCRMVSYEVPLMREVTRKVKDIYKAEGDIYRFPSRELVQNADDAKAQIITFRIEKEALYVANDGREFEPPDIENDLPGDLEKLCSVLTPSKEFDSESTGAHGSGFQTVYAFTNQPEIHSNYISVRLNPTHSSKEGRVKIWESSGTPKECSPYHPKGALFVFPWRKERDSIGEFADNKIWPIWTQDRVEEFVHDIINYAHDMILCCQHIKAIRVVWGNLPEAFQVQRKGFHLDKVPEDFYEGIIEEGLIEVHSDWELSFAFIENPKWKTKLSPEEGWRYLIGSDFVTNHNGMRLYYGEDLNGNELITDDIDDLGVDGRTHSRKKIKLKGNVHLLFPLFNIEDRPNSRESYFRYSVLPLPSIGKNRFVSTGHLLIAENRSSILLAPEETNGRWFIETMRSLLKLHMELVEEYIERIDHLNIPTFKKQRLILNAVPLDPIERWIHPEGGKTNVFNNHNSKLISDILRLPILYSLQCKEQGGCNGTSACENVNPSDRLVMCLSSPLDAFWIDLEEEREEVEYICRRLGGKTLTTFFTDHEAFQHILINSELLKELRLNDTKLIELWNSFKEKNQQEGKLSLGVPLSDGSELDELFLRKLISYCQSSSKRETPLGKLPIIPDQTGILRPLQDYLIVPKAYSVLNKILPPEQTVHEHFLNLIRNFIKQEPNVNEIILHLSRAIRTHPEKFKDLEFDCETHRIISEIIVKAIEDSIFSLRELKDCSFIPYEQRGKIQIGEPNKEPSGKILDDPEHQGENYTREHIFKTQKKEVLGLSRNLRKGMKFLCLSNVSTTDTENVEKNLKLVALQEKDIPTNFVRVYISPKFSPDAKSLFVDSALKDFLIKEAGLPSRDVTNQMLKEEKKTLLRAVSSYFRPGTTGTERGLKASDMRKVPCLYDPQGVWRPPEEFSYDFDSCLSIFGKKPLCKDFLEWDKETLVNRLGVSEFLDIADIVETIRKWADIGNAAARANLKVIIEYLLFNKSSLATKSGVMLKDLPELKGLKWVPVINKHLIDSERALVPTDHNRNLMGDSYCNMVDLSKKAIVLIDSGEYNGIVQNRSKEIGLKIIPYNEDLLMIIEELSKKNLPPPPKLFDELSESTRTSGYPENIYQKEVPSPKYYLNGEWINAKKIRLLDKEKVPSQLHPHFIFLTSDIKRHERYLRYFLGVTEKIIDKEILELMINRDVSIDLTLWNFLIETTNSSDVDKDYGGYEIFPCPENNYHLLAPNRIILGGKASTFNRPGPWGGWYVLDELALYGNRVFDKLLSLGAKKEIDLTSDEIRDILYSMTWEGRKLLDEETRDRMLLLLRKLSEFHRRGFDVKLDSPCYPAIINNNYIVCKRIRDCYKKDYFKWYLFDGILPFLDVIIDGKYSQEIEEFFNSFEPHSLAKELKVKPIPHGSAEEDISQTRRFNLIYDGMEAYLNRLPNITEEQKSQIKKGFNWLKQCIVIRYTDIEVQYMVKGVSPQSTNGFFIDKRGGQYVVQVAKIGTLNMILDLSIEIFNTSGTFYPSEPLFEMESQLISQIYNMLTYDIRKWKYYSGYHYEGEEVPPPLLEVELDFTSKGYHKTRQHLKDWYKACQFDDCRIRTPYDDSGDETCEVVVSLFSNRGSRYYGSFDEYSPENCIFLCPTHGTLFQRKLIKIPLLEEGFSDGPVKVKELADRQIREYSDQLANGDKKLDTDIHITWLVFEDPLDHERGWKRRDMVIRLEHHLMILRNISNRMKKEIGDVQEQH